VEKTMDDISQIEEYYKNSIKNINSLLPEGIIEVDLKLLQKYNLLQYHRQEKQDRSLTRYFNVIETNEKITLINDQFIVWIIPEKYDYIPITYTLIALNDEHSTHLEMAFAASGCYNSSRLVLRLLEIFLLEIQETEEMLLKFKRAS
jgi:hypothetical protein